MESRKLVFFVLSAAVLVDTLIYGLIAPLVPYYSDHLGISPGQIGTIFAAYSFALLVTSVPAGVSCDSWGYRPVLVGGTLLLAAATLSYAFAESYWLLILSRLVQGAAGSFIWTASLAAAAALYANQARGGRLGLMIALTGLGTIAGPIMSGFVFKALGYRAIFYITVLLILPVTAWFAVNPLPVDCRGREGRAAGPGMFLRVLGDRRALPAFILVVAGSFGWGLLEPLLPLHLSGEFGMDSRGIGVVFAVLSLGYSVLQPYWGYLSDRIGYRPVIVAGLVVTALTMPLVFLVRSMPVFYIFCLVSSIASCAMLTPSLPMLADFAEKEGINSYGVNFGLVNASYSVGLLAGPAVGGLIAQYFSIPAAAFFYSASLLPVLLYFVSSRKDVKSA